MASGVVGVDIGSTGIRAVEVKGVGANPSIRKHGQVALPPGVVEGGVVVQPHAVTQALTQLWEEAKFSTNQVRLGVGSSSVLARPLELDWMPQEDLRKSLRYQIEDLLPVPVDDANIDHIYLGEHTLPSDGVSPPRRMIRILLIATARDGVDEMVRAVKGAKLQPVGVDLGALALVRASAAAAPAAPSEAILDIGVDKVTIAIHTRGRPHLIRVIPNVGSGLITRQLMEETGRDWPSAEQTKCSGIPLPAPGHSPASQDQAVIAGAVHRMLTSTRDTLEFHANTDPDSFPESVKVHGAAVALPGLLDQVSDALGIPAYPYGTQAVTASGGPDQANLALPLGLCMEMTAS